MFGKRKQRDEERRPGREGREIPESDRESPLTREMREREGSESRRAAPAPERDTSRRAAPAPEREDTGRRAAPAPETATSELGKRRSFQAADVADRNAELGAAPDRYQTSAAGERERARQTGLKRNEAGDTRR